MSIYGPQIASFTLPGDALYYSGGVLRSPSWKMANPSTPSVAEESVWLLVNDNFTASNLTVATSVAQPSDGDTVITVRKNGADTALTVTVPASAAAGSFSDTANSVSFVAGDYYSVSATKNGSSVAAPIVACLHTFV